MKLKHKKHKRKSKRIIWNLLTFTLFILSFNIISAISSDEISYYYQRGKPFDINRECFYNGGYCNQSAFSCYLTVYYPNESIFKNHSLMTGYTNYYSLPVTETNIPNGIYRNSMSCSDGINQGSEIFYFELNNTGDGRGVSLFLILGFGSVLILGIAIVTKNGYIGFAGGALMIVLGVYTMIFGIYSLSDDYTRAIAYTCIGLGLFFEVSAGYRIADQTNSDEDAGALVYDDFAEFD